MLDLVKNSVCADNLQVLILHADLVNSCGNGNVLVVWQEKNSTKIDQYSWQMHLSQLPTACLLLD